MKRFAAALSLALAVGHSSDLWAQESASPSVEDIKTAEAAFSKGRDAFKNGDFAEAAENFEKADASAPNEKVLELAITARENAGHLDRAATLSALALERHPDSERLKKVANAVIAKAQASTLQVTIDCDEACSLLDGTRLVHGAPSQKRVVFLSPGKHKIRAGWSEGRSEEKRVDGAAGTSAALSFAAPPIPVAPPPEAEPAVQSDVTADTRGVVEPGSGLPPLYFWIAAGVTAAVGGVTIWSGVDTLSNPGKAAVREQCAGQGESCSLYQDGQDKELRTNILLGATGVLGAGTILLGALFTDWSGGETTAASGPVKSARITPWIGVGNGATVGASGRF